MARIGSIDGIPLFTTREEALAWGASNGLSGYHKHNYGYMGGLNHSQAKNSRKSTPTQTNTSSGSNRSGGGY